MRIRHLRLAAVTAATAVLIGLGGAAPALAASPQEDVLSTDARLGDALNTLFDVFNDASASAEELLATTDAFVPEAQHAADEFARIADEAGDGAIQGFASDFAGESRSLAAAADDLGESIRQQDEASFNQAAADLDAALNAYVATADEYNRYVADNPLASGDGAYASWLILLVVSAVLLIAAILFAILARGHQGALPAKTGKNGRTQQTTLSGLRRNMIIWSAVFVVGAAIPFVQYWILVHNGGDSYWVFWYPLAAGAILFLVSVVQYLVATARIARHGSAPLLSETPLTPPADLGADDGGAAQPGGSAAEPEGAIELGELPAQSAAPAPAAPAPGLDRSPWEPKER